MRALRVMCLYFLILHTRTTEYRKGENELVKRALQRSHEKSQIEKLKEAFLGKEKFDQDASLIELLKTIANEYFLGCTAIILYDNYTQKDDSLFLKTLFIEYPLLYAHALVASEQHTRNFVGNRETCVNFLVFIKDVMRCQNYIGKRKEKVVVVAKSSQWRVKEFLASENSQDIPNLVIIAKSDQIIRDTGESPYILYTHNLFVDGLGSSKPMVLTSWYGGNFTRPMNLFRPKMRHGVSGHRFVISVAHQPPFVIKQQTNNDEQEYEGIEIRLIELLAEMYNFTIDYREAPNAKLLGAAEAVLKTIETNTVNLGLAGLYITDDRYNSGTFEWHSEDCAAFVSLTSTALPRYRAIMGPFRWTVWLTLTLVYMFSILLFSFSDKLTLRHLITNPEELENLFWYMFGTFTNCFTFTGKNSWTKADKLTTKLLIGIYWMFTIIITACYTGSIIAFVTLPVFPTVVDTIDQLIAGRFDIGMLDKGGWQNWFHNLTDARSKKLLQQPDYVPNVESGFKNVTKAFFWPYAFLGSREQLKYIAKTNFTIEGKRNLLHISSQCFATYKVGILIPTDSVYKNLVKRGIRLAFEFGLVDKMKSDVEWKMMRSSTGKLLAANSKTGLRFLSTEDRALTLDDTQGMFLLLGMGFLIGGGILMSEWFGGCLKLCKKNSDGSSSGNSSIPSNPRFHERQTPRAHNLKSESIEHLINGDSLVESTDSHSESNYSEEISKIFGEALQNHVSEDDTE